MQLLWAVVLRTPDWTLQLGLAELRMRRAFALPAPLVPLLPCRAMLLASSAYTCFMHAPLLPLQTLAGTTAVLHSTALCRAGVHS